MASNCGQHPKTIEKYSGSLKELAEDIGNLRYKELAELMHSLAYKISEDSDKDWIADRKKLALKLSYVALSAREMAELIEGTWDICKLYMDD